MMQDQILTYVLGLGAQTALLVVGLIIWQFQKRREVKIAAHERSYQFRLTIYEKLLEPFYLFLSTLGQGSDAAKKAEDIIASDEYGRAYFKLLTFGSDEAIRQFNLLMSFLRETRDGDPIDLTDKRFVERFGALLLAIRRDMYGPSSQLKIPDTTYILRIIEDDLKG